MNTAQVNECMNELNCLNGCMDKRMTELLILIVMIRNTFLFLCFYT